MNWLHGNLRSGINVATSKLQEASGRFVPAVWQSRQHYSRKKLRGDLLAGLTAGALALPQAIGFALIAGLPTHMVLTSVVVAGLAGAWFTSSNHASIGPTNTTSLFIGATAASTTVLGFTAPQVAVFLALAVGLIQLAAGFARLGNLTQFISRSVILGYTCGAAALIGFGQIPNALGIAGVRGANLLETARLFGVRVVDQGIHWPSLALSAATIFFMLACKKLLARWPAGLIALAVGTIVSAALGAHDRGVRTVADIGGLEGRLPVFSGLPESWLTSLPMLLNAAFAFAVMGMLEAVSITKNLALKTNERIDSNQELLALGAGNTTAALFGAMPASGSFLRSAVLLESGGATQIASIIASLGLGAGLLIFSPLAGLIPIPAVASMLVLVSLQMVNLATVRTVVRATKADSIVFVTTFVGTLILNLDTAIYVGIGVSLALFLQKAASPSLVEYTFNDSGHLTQVAAPEARIHPRISIIHVEGDLFFGAADLFQDEIRRLSDDPNLRVFVLRMKNARHLDGSTVLALQQLSEHLRRQNRFLLVSGIHGDVAEVFKRSGLAELVGAENIFPAEENPNLATKKALQRAQVLLGKESDVRLFYTQSAANHHQVNQGPGLHVTLPLR